ncbi:flagellar brake protein [Pelomonas sp. APW6]|uniref:Flagellar brake protein YcgR n=1 Tax=Roseateles subflavus TaxID=3053353 RepID=A0ABT7LN72_9BURK|nr:flagellar brake protein [Pelomonas sp. APW6]MDL5033595.1 flagellar brake protein [Pelomonas sp. APW6]
MSLPDTAAPLDLDDQQRENYRVSTPVEIAAYLRELMSEQARVYLRNPEGLDLHTTLCVLDAKSGLLGLDLPHNSSRAESLLESDEITATAYLASIRLEFELEQPVIVRDGGGSVLRAALPRRLYRFQRRQTFRVQPTGINYPLLQLRHPAQGQLMSLRVLDVSMGGLGLLLPGDEAALPPGLALPGCVLELDRDTRLEVGLKLLHVTQHAEVQSGRHLGCAFETLPPDTARALQLYIDQTQKRRRQMRL